MKQFVSVEQVMNLIARIVECVRRNVSNPKELAKISKELEKLQNYEGKKKPIPKDRP
jgi:LytS/YehU family sensor histidine kinase